MKHTLLKTALIFSVVLFSCETDDEPKVIETESSLGVYENSVFVINEGNFGDGDGSISAYKKKDSTVDQTIFKAVNDLDLGDVVQSATVHDSLMFIVVNNSNRVEVVNAYTFESIYSLTDVALPRYVAVGGEKGYLTEWVSFSEPGRVTIFDLATGNIESRIAVGFGAEDILVEDDKIYVSNSFGNTVSIIDLTDNTSQELELSASPKQMKIDMNGDLWVACAGGFDANFNPSNDGALHKVSLSTQTKLTLELNTNYSAKIAMNTEGSIVYYYVNDTVFAQDISSFSMAKEAFISNENAISIYGIGVDPKTDMIYLGDSKSFIEDGEVYQYNSSGMLVTTFAAGRGPNGFVFN